MDAFPDELLLEVLGRIDDGLTLLDVVPLVCKRWHRLARDPGAWNSASVAIRVCRFYEGRTWRENHDEILDAARVLIHAPALRRVSFDWRPSDEGTIFTCSSDRGTMTSALDRCAAEVREILFSPYSFDVSDTRLEDLYFLADFLSKKSSCVRYLDLGNMLHAQEPLLHALGQCENLEELHLMVPGRRCNPYRGELRGQRLPKLKRLTLESLFTVENCRAFLRDLAGCVAQSVRHVRCEVFCESSEEVLAELSQCVELRSLVCGVESVALAGTLPRLRSLSLAMEPYAYYGQGHEALSAAERALRRCGELQDLSDLRLDDGSWYIRKWDAEHTEAMSGLLATLATKATNVKHLYTNCTLKSLVSPETLLAFMKSLPRLESIHMDSFEVDILPSLAELKGLKRFSCELDDYTGEVHLAALAQFKRQRPDVDCRHFRLDRIDR